MFIFAQKPAHLYTVQCTNEYIYVMLLFLYTWVHKRVCMFEENVIDFHYMSVSLCIWVWPPGQIWHTTVVPLHPSPFTSYKPLSPSSSFITLRRISSSLFTPHHPLPTLTNSRQPSPTLTKFMAMRWNKGRKR